jgi:GH15 family glucan-1,4-alpha-glucosidase
MCWAACDRLARIAARIGETDRAHAWRGGADRIRRFIDERCWSTSRRCYVASAGGETLDASLLLLHELGYTSADNPRFASTVRAIESDLKQGDFIFRYVESDDFGAPENAFVVCSFWYANALSALGRRDQARDVFERLLGHRNRHGLLSEHIEPTTGEHWGNFVQTYSMVGLITSAIRISVPWEEAF